MKFVSVIWLGELTKFEGNLVRYFSWGNHGRQVWGNHPGRGTQRRLCMLSKNPKSIRLVREQLNLREKKQVLRVTDGRTGSWTRPLCGPLFLSALAALASVRVLKFLVF